MTYYISGKVTKGDGYGRKIGFPTANLEVTKGDLPLPGVYAGNAVLEEKNYRAGIVIGPGDKVEAHLIGYNGDAYGKTIILEVNEFLRKFENFETEEALIAQIQKDLEKC